MNQWDNQSRLAEAKRAFVDNNKLVGWYGRVLLVALAIVSAAFTSTSEMPSEPICSLRRDVIDFPLPANGLLLTIGLLEDDPFAMLELREDPTPPKNATPTPSAGS
jgi:hypothetical protein